MMNSIKVSVIVPIYNVSKYLSDCIISIQKQTLHDIEIILANDGSTDISYAIAKQFADSDSRIKCFTHDNMGLGATRNHAMAQANGKYLVFVDSDDYISEDMVESLYNMAESTKADVVQGETMIFRDPEKGSLRKSLADLKEYDLKNQSEKTFYKDYYFSRLYSHNAWDKIYLTEFIRKHNILFGDNMRIFAEDNWFQLQVLYRRPKISFLPKVCYWYRQQDNSIMHLPKQNLLVRHAEMIKDYRCLIQSETNTIETRVCDLVGFDYIVLETFNQRLSKVDFVSFTTILQKIKEEHTIAECVYNATKNKSYKLEPNIGKQVFIILISILYRMNAFKLANRIIWSIYVNR